MFVCKLPKEEGAARQGEARAKLRQCKHGVWQLPSTTLAASASSFRRVIRAQQMTNRICVHACRKFVFEPFRRPMQMEIQLGEPLQIDLVIP